MPKKKGTLVIVSGPAGSGKTSLVEALIKKNPHVTRAVTATTRNPRPGEKDTVDYFFLTKEEFNQRIVKNLFIEYTQFNNHYYGTPQKELKDKIDAGGVIILVIEVDGAESIRFFFPEALFIFVLPPDPESLIKRLNKRGTDSKSDIEHRLMIAKRELERVSEYDFLIINAELDNAVLDLEAVIRVAGRLSIRGGEKEKWELGYFSDWTGEDQEKENAERK